MCLRSVALMSFCVPLALTAQAVPQGNQVPLRGWTVPLGRLLSGTGSSAVHSLNAELVLDDGAGDTVAVSEPCRAVDTRPVSQSGATYPAGYGPPSLVAGATRTFNFASSLSPCPAPSGTVGYLINITTVNQSALGYLTIWADNQPMPATATDVFPPGAPFTYAAVVPAGADGGIDLFANVTTDVVIDIGGFVLNPNLTPNSSNNTAVGTDAGFGLTTGTDNTIVGSGAGLAITTGISNTLFGFNAGAAITTGGQNTLIGENAGQNLFSGNNNTIIGDNAGNILGIGSNNIYIGSNGPPGATSESNSIRIGNQMNATNPNGQNALYEWAADTPLTGSTIAALVMNITTGQIGIGTTSSARYKEDIHDMADASSDLLRLRPVTFRYKKPDADGSKPIDYGLIAEEVAEVYPGLVLRGPDGKIEIVQYQKLTPMLLNEFQKQHDELAQLKEANRKLEERLAALEAVLNR